MNAEAIVMIVVAGILGVFSVPIVWMLTAHQRKMAEIIHRGQGAIAQNGQEALTSEVRELKQVVYQQAIALDSLTSEVRKTLSPPPIPAEALSARLGQDSSAT